MTDNLPATVDEMTIDPADAAELIEHLAQLAADQSTEPEPLAAGTFVLYPMPDGGMMFVTAVDQGALAGIKHTRINPGLIRAISVIASGGSKLAAVKALAGFGQRREIASGE